MTEQAANSILQRIAVANRTAPPLATSPERALTDACIRVSDKLLSLQVVGQSCQMSRVSLGELLDMLPDKSLLAVIEGPGEAQGLLALDPMLFSALIEQQTRGTVNPVAPAARRATRTDATLISDWIDKVLALFGTSLQATGDVRWSYGYTYSTALPDPRPLALLLDETTFVVLNQTLSIGSAEREGTALLAMIADGRGPEPVIASKPQVVDSKPAASVTGAPSDPEKWQEDLGAAVQTATVELTAVLHRIPMSISSISKLEAGDTISLPLTSVGAVRVEDLNGQVVAEGRLGQLNGMCAIRINGGDTPKPNPERFIASDGSTMPVDAAALAPDGMASGPLQTAAPGIFATSPPNVDLPEMPELADLSDLPGLADEHEIDAMVANGQVPDGDFSDDPMDNLPSLDDLPALDDLPSLDDFPSLDDLPEIE
jgi:flagellar motor switch protein FliM